MCWGFIRQFGPTNNLHSRHLKPPNPKSRLHSVIIAGSTFLTAVCSSTYLYNYPDIRSPKSKPDSGHLRENLAPHNNRATFYTEISSRFFKKQLALSNMTNKDNPEKFIKALAKPFTVSSSESVEEIKHKYNIECASNFYLIQTTGDQNFIIPSITDNIYIDIFSVLSTYQEEITHYSVVFRKGHFDLSFLIQPSAHGSRNLSLQLQQSKQSLIDEMSHINTAIVNFVSYLIIGPIYQWTSGLRKTNEYMVDACKAISEQKPELIAGNEHYLVDYAAFFQALILLDNFRSISPVYANAITDALDQSKSPSDKILDEMMKNIKNQK